jgi:transposase
MTELQQKRINNLKITKEKRKSQLCRVFELKINYKSLNKKEQQELNFIFVQAKRVINDMITISKTESIFKYNYKNHRIVKVRYPDKHLEDKEITLPTAIHQDICQSKMLDIKNLSKAKKKGRKIGKLKYKKEINTIPIRTGMIRLNSKNKNKLTFPGFKNIRVNGTNQFIKLKNYEIANANLLRKATGFYIHLTVFLPKTKKEKINKSIGIDMGIKTAIVTSEGNIYNAKIKESEHLKKLQKKLSRKKQDSNNFRKIKKAIQKEYEYLTNKKNDLANKVVSELKKYDTIYFQDEQLSNWKKRKRIKKSSKRKKTRIWKSNSILYFR